MTPEEIQNIIERTRTIKANPVGRPRKNEALHGSTPTSGVPVTRNDLFDDEDKVDTTPVSKRQVKNRSGRAGRRMWNGQRNLQSVGGYANAIEAIYQPADKELCNIVDPRRGYNEDGTPYRF